MITNLRMDLFQALTSQLPISLTSSPLCTSHSEQAGGWWPGLTADRKLGNILVDDEKYLRGVWRLLSSVAERGDVCNF